jgi:DNA-binding MarR family transcriptional regulator
MTTSEPGSGSPQAPRTSIDRNPVDLTTAHDLDVARRIGAAWRNLRRGASSMAVREYFYGRGAAREDDASFAALEAGQMDTLDVLVHRPSWRMSDLAEALRVDPSTATRAVQRLVNLNLAERKPDPEDGRVVMVRATSEGRDRHARVERRRGYVICTLMSAFTDEERTMLADLMGRFVHELDELVKELPAGESPSVASEHG